MKVCCDDSQPFECIGRNNKSGHRQPISVVKAIIVI
jgi:hypothetical protein